jgi:hypothetical protein
MDVEPLSGYARSSLIPAAVELATNGWFAVTLADTFQAPVAAQLLKDLKAERRVPDDAYITYGNTYVRKICCD